MDELEISGKRYISTRRAAKEYKYHADYIGQLIRAKKLLGRKVGRSWYVELESLTAYFGGEGAAIPPAPMVAKTVDTPSPAPAPKVEEPIETPLTERKVEEKVIERLAALLKSEVVDEVARQAPPIVAEKVEEKIEEQKEESKKDSEEVNEGETKIEIHAEPVRDSIHIPIRVRRPSFAQAAVEEKKPTLRYMSDDTPVLPRTKKEHVALSAVHVMPRAEREIERAEEPTAEEVQEKVVITPGAAKKNTFMPIVSVAAAGIIALGVVVLGSIMINSQTIIEAGKTASVGYSL